MAKVKYQDKSFIGKSLNLIDLANEIIAEYQEQGFDLTLRQLYYQMVARDIIENSDKSYDRMGRLVSDARMAGLIDWDAIVDRTRSLRGNSHWTSPASILRSAEYSYQTDHWEGQKYRVEAWVEKDALGGVVGVPCRELDVPYFSCRGYSSQSEMRSAGQRLYGYIRRGIKPVIIHLGDHDPSGIDMTRDIIDRLQVFTIDDDDAGYLKAYEGEDFIVERIALNYDQIRTYNPPPNPAKLTDSRVGDYIKKFGRSSWELDALSPTVIADLIRATVLRYRDEEKYQEAVQATNDGKRFLAKVRRDYEDGKWSNGAGE